MPPGRAIGARLPGAVETLGERAHLGFERLDRLARHGLGQRPADLGEIAAQRAETVFVGLMQRGNLRVDVAELLLQAGKFWPVARLPARCGAARWHCRRGGSGMPPSSARWRAEICAAQLAGPRAGAAGGAEALAVAVERRRRERARRSTSLAAARPSRDDLVEPAIEPCQRLRDAVGRTLIGAGRAGDAPAALDCANAFELPREIVETIVDGGEVVADRVLVVVMLSV